MTPWSYSQLSTFIHCPLKHFFKYVLGLPERSTPSPLALGHAAHEALADYHRGLQLGRTLSREVILAAFLRSWQERKGRELITYPQGTEQGTLDQGVALLEAYLQELPPEGIVAVEEQITVPLVTSGGEVLDRQLLAVLDLLTRDADGLKVTDIKTSSRAYSDMDARTSLQATAYLYAAQEQYRETATFRYAVLVKTKKAKVQTVETAQSNPFNVMGPGVSFTYTQPDPSNSYNMTFTATVCPPSGNSPAPTGTVSFFVDGNNVATTGDISKGQNTVTIFLAADSSHQSHTVRTQYNGDSNYGPASSHATRPVPRPWPHGWTRRCSLSRPKQLRTHSSHRPRRCQRRASRSPRRNSSTPSRTRSLPNGATRARYST